MLAYLKVSLFSYSLTHICLGLILALEPEAASLCCRYNRRELHYEAGTKYMIIDCGGGTVDIAVHELDENGIVLFHSNSIEGFFWLFGLRSF